MLYNILACVVLFVPGHILLAQAYYEYDIVGSYYHEVPDYESADTRRTKRTAQPFGFRMAVRGNKWLIISDHAFTNLLQDISRARSSPPLPMPKRTIAVCDGNQFFMVKYMRDKTETNHAEATAYRGPGTVPFGLGPAVAGVWYLYGSHEYMRGRTNSFIVPLDYHERAIELSVTGVPAVWGLLDKPPHLPQGISFYGYISTPGLNGGPRDVLVLPPEQRMYTNTALRVLRTTNVNGIEYPLETYIENTQVDHKRQKSNGLHLIYHHYTGRTVFSLREVHPHAPEALFAVPVLWESTMVGDYRYANGNPRAKVITVTNRWPEDAYIAARAEARIKIPERRQTIATPIQAVIAGLIIILPMALALLARRPKESNSE